MPGVAQASTLGGKFHRLWVGRTLSLGGCQGRVVGRAILEEGGSLPLVGEGWDGLHQVYGRMWEWVSQEETKKVQEWYKGHEKYVKVRRERERFTPSHRRVFSPDHN